MDGSKILRFESRRERTTLRAGEAKAGRAVKFSLLILMPSHAAQALCWNDITGRARNMEGAGAPQLYHHVLRECCVYTFSIYTTRATYSTHQQIITVISDRFQPRLICVGLFSSCCPQLRATTSQLAIMPPVSTRVIAS